MCGERSVCGLLGDQNQSWRCSTNRLNKLIRKSGYEIGCKLHTFEAVVERRSLNNVIHYRYSLPPFAPLTGQAAEHFL